MAELAPGCPAETNWKILRRIAGDINGVKFHIYAGHFYTDLLSEQEIEAISGHPWINLVCLRIDEGEETDMAPSPTPLGKDEIAGLPNHTTASLYPSQNMGPEKKIARGKK